MAPIISVSEVGLKFNKGRRSQSLRERLLWRPSSVPEAREFWALRDVSFTVEPGEAIGVVGRNGSGKSTLLKLVAGVMIPDEGTIEVREATAPFIEITGGFVPELTGREDISLSAGLHGMSPKEIAERFDEIVGFSGVGEFLDMPSATTPRG